MAPTDWELVEDRDFGIYSYSIFKVTDNGRTYFRGTVIRDAEIYCLDGDDTQALRNTLIELGRRN